MSIAGGGPSFCSVRPSLLDDEPSDTPERLARMRLSCVQESLLELDEEESERSTDHEKQADIEQPGDTERSDDMGDTDRSAEFGTFGDYLRPRGSYGDTESHEETDGDVDTDRGGDGAVERSGDTERDQGFAGDIDTDRDFRQKFESEGEGDTERDTERDTEKGTESLFIESEQQDSERSSVDQTQPHLSRSQPGSRSAPQLAAFSSRPGARTDDSAVSSQAASLSRPAVPSQAASLCCPAVPSQAASLCRPTVLPTSFPSAWEFMPTQQENVKPGDDTYREDDFDTAREVFDTAREMEVDTSETRANDKEAGIEIIDVQKTLLQTQSLLQASRESTHAETAFFLSRLRRQTPLSPLTGSTIRTSPFKTYERAPEIEPRPKEAEGPEEWSRKPEADSRPPQEQTETETRKWESETRRPGETRRLLNMAVLCPPTPAGDRTALKKTVAKKAPPPTEPAEPVLPKETNKAHLEKSAETPQEKSLRRLLSCLNVSDLCDTMHGAKDRLAKSTVKEASGDSLWQVRMEELCAPKCGLLQEISGGLAYVAAWELSEERCQVSECSFSSRRGA